MAAATTGRFIATLIDHRVLGMLVVPYWVSREKDKEYFTVNERITLANLFSLQDKLSNEQIELVKTIEQYSDTCLAKLFSKKKVSSQDFIANIQPELFNDMIRPYIEKRITNCIDLLIESETPFYFKDSQNNIYDDDRIWLDDEPAETVFNFDRSPETFKYFLTVRHKEEIMQLIPESIILVDSPCRLIMKNKLYAFDDIDGKKLLPFFDKDFITIPKSAELKYLDSFVKNSIKNYSVSANGFDIKEHKPEPKCILSLEKNFSGNPVFNLSFDYGDGNVFYAQKDTSVVVKLTENKKGQITFIKTIRDLVFEKVRISQLMTLGLKNTNTSSFEIPEITSIEDKGDKLQEYICWLNENSQTIKNKHFILQQKFDEQDYNLDTVTLKMSVKDDKDWFDIKAIVHIGEHKIAFTHFANHIINGIREFTLPDGKVVILPKEWFEKYKDLASFGEAEGDLLRLKKHHFAVVKQSIKSVNKKHIKSLSEVEDIHNQKVDLPKNINATLRPYQHEGYSWMYSYFKSGLGVCLADDMGLGKTLQTITLIAKVIENKAQKKESVKEVTGGMQLSIFDTVENTGTEVNIKSFVPASLVVMPSSLIHNWKHEIKKFAPHLKVKIHTGNNRNCSANELDKYDVVLTTYGLVRNDIEKLTKYDFFYVILDESQYIKNPLSKIYKSMLKLNAQHRLVLTGTPIENSLTDLWSQMNFLNHGLLGNLNFFKKEFLLPIEKHQIEEKEEKLKSIISPFILRRKKSEVAKDLPDLSENTVYCDMSEEQKNLYEEEKSKARNEILENIEKHGKDKSAIIILQALTRLRQIANHPRLADIDSQIESGKFEEVIRNIENLIKEGHKVLIFSSFVKNLELFKDYFSKNNHKYSWLTGETRNRESVIKQFQEDEATKLFLISLKAGGVGLNLTAADYVFILDPWWNPAVENQAINRAHRIGQTKNVFVYRFISNDSIEEKILKLQNKKASLAESFMSDQNVFSSISVNELLNLVK